MSIWIDKAGRRHVGVMVGGKRVHRILPPSATAGDAKRAEASIRAAIGSREVTIPGDPPLTGVMTLYLTHAKGLRSPETATMHAQRASPWLVGYRASEARQACAAMVADMSKAYAPATINRTLGAIKKALRIAWLRGTIATDHSSAIKRLPENNKRDTYLTIEQVRELADCAGATTRAVIWIALFTGCRRGEICKITAADIGPDTLRIQAGNTKTLKRRDVPIVSALRPWLGYLPLAINEAGIKSGFNRARAKAKLEHVNFHDLRHSCATIMLASGVDLYVISKILGHSTIKTTERYSHLQVDAQREALEKAFG